MSFCLSVLKKYIFLYCIITRFSDTSSFYTFEVSLTSDIKSAALYKTVLPSNETKLLLGAHLSKRWAGGGEVFLT